MDEAYSAGFPSKLSREEDGKNGKIMRGKVFLFFYFFSRCLEHQAKAMLIPKYRLHNKRRRKKWEETGKQNHETPNKIEKRIGKESSSNSS